MIFPYDFLQTNFRSSRWQQKKVRAQVIFSALLDYGFTAYRLFP